MTARPAGSATPLVGIATAIAAVTALKVFWIFAEVSWDPAKAPWFFLVALTGPFALAAWLLHRGTRGATVLMSVACAALVLIVANYLRANGTSAAASDVAVLYVGGPLALVGLVLAIRRLGGRAVAE